MNVFVGIGRLTRDPEVRYSTGQNQMAVARYTLAIDRNKKRDEVREGEPTADFIQCVAFGKFAEHAEKYYHKGIKIAVQSHVQTGSYVNKNGDKVYTTEFVIDRQEFAESKQQNNGGYAPGGWPEDQGYYPAGNGSDQGWG